MENESKKVDPVQTPSTLIGATTKAVPLGDTVKLDIDTAKVLIDNIIEAGISGGLDTGALESFSSISNNRDQIYQLVDTMSKDSSVSSILRVYAEDCTEASDSGQIMWCEASDPKISKFVNYLLSVMNVDKNLYGWAYALVKYGDVYLRLFRESDYQDPLFKKDSINRGYSAGQRQSLTEDMSLNMNFDAPDEAATKDTLEENIILNVHDTNDRYSGYMEMIADPSTMFELTKYGKVYGYVETPNADLPGFANNSITAGGIDNPTGLNYRLKSNEVIVYQADDFVHACLEDHNTRFPEQVSIFMTEDDYKLGANAYTYNVRRGKSLLYDAYKVWREKALLESSALLNRVTRSSIIRKVGVEVGDMPKEKVTQTLRRVKEMMEQKMAIDPNNSMSEYTNPGPIENNIYYATHGGQGQISVDTIGGDVNIRDLADLEWWNDKFYSAFGIPKQFMGWCFSKDTEVLLLDGNKLTMEELYKNKELYVDKGIMACNTDGSLCPTKITNIIQTSTNAELLRVWLNNGNFVDVTPDHRMMLRDGTFIEAKNLAEGASLMPYFDKTEDGKLYVLDNKLGEFVLQGDSMTMIEQDTSRVEGRAAEELDISVLKIEYLSSGNTVYDITVEADCHTFALPCGVFVHNCDDGAGFNGGTSLALISSVYAKGVKKIQNALVQMITDAVNLMLINRGLKSYINNFTIKMKAPLTQEEKDYRDGYSTRISAISSFMSLLADVDDRARKLTILKELVSGLNVGDTVLQELQKEIAAAEKQAIEAEEAAKKEAEEAATAATEPGAQTEAGGEEEELLSMEDLQLGESLSSTRSSVLTEDAELPKADEVPLELDEQIDASTIEAVSDCTNEDLPTPEALAPNIDFTKNI